MTLRIERMESVIAPSNIFSKIIKAVGDFCSGVVDGFLGR